MLMSFLKIKINLEKFPHRLTSGPTVHGPGPRKRLTVHGFKGLWNSGFDTRDPLDRDSAHGELDPLELDLCFGALVCHVDANVALTGLPCAHEAAVDAELAVTWMATLTNQR